MKRTCGDGKGGEDIRRQNWQGWAEEGKHQRNRESRAARDGEENEERMVQEATAQRGTESDPAEAKQKGTNKGIH